jgi:glucose/arabinose dehydrogenase
LPAAEIELYLDMDGDELLSDDSQKVGVESWNESGAEVVSVSDWRDFPTIEVDTVSIVDDLDAPWAFTFLPNGDILISERFGNLKLFTNGEIINITGVPEVFSSGQWGMLDIIAHPKFSENNFVYLSYVNGTQQWNGLYVGRWRLIGGVLENFEVIFEVEEKKSGTSHFGSRFAWLPDNTLVFSVGDGWNPPITYDGELIRKQAQNLSAHLWKTIRIQDDWSIPQDNPFVGRSDVQPHIYSYGHRNIQWIAYDTIHERLVASEHGSKWGDELNQIVSWKNYWRPLVSYATEYDVAGTLITDQQSLSWFVDPLSVWTPTIAPSAVLSNTSDIYPERKWDLFLAAMLIRSNNSIGAYASSPAGAVLRVDMDTKWNIIGQERIYVWDVRVRSIAQWPDWYIYALTDDTSPQKWPWKNAGRIVKLRK